MGWWAEMDFQELGSGKSVAVVAEALNGGCGGAEVLESWLWNSVDSNADPAAG